MSDISVGAVGAALVAGFISLIGLIIAKEQKISEFRQNWIDDLRKCFVAYLVTINAIADALALKKAGKPIDDAVMIVNYKSLNEATHGIKFRINHSEDTAQKLLFPMKAFESIFANNADITASKVKSLEEQFEISCRNLLKFEWDRVKRGEDTFVIAKRIVNLAVASALVLFVYACAFQAKEQKKEDGVFPKPQPLTGT